MTVFFHKNDVATRRWQHKMKSFTWIPNFEVQRAKWKLSRLGSVLSGFVRCVLKGIDMEKTGWKLEYGRNMDLMIMVVVLFYMFIVYFGC